MFSQTHPCENRRFATLLRNQNLHTQVASVSDSCKGLRISLSVTTLSWLKCTTLFFSKKVFIYFFLPFGFTIWCPPAHFQLTAVTSPQWGGRRFPQGAMLPPQPQQQVFVREVKLEVVQQLFPGQCPGSTSSRFNTPKLKHVKTVHVTCTWSGLQHRHHGHVQGPMPRSTWPLARCDDGWSTYDQGWRNWGWEHNSECCLKPKYI